VNRIHFLYACMYECGLEDDGSTWTLRCDPSRRRGHRRDDRFDGNSFQDFSGVCVEDDSGRLYLCRVFAIILLRYKEEPTDDYQLSQYRFIVSQMVKPAEGRVPLSYLPYAMYQHKKTRTSGVDIRFIAQESIVRPAMFIPIPDGSIGYGNFETKANMHDEDHYFFGIDSDRFNFPKPKGFKCEFYSRLPDDTEASRPAGRGGRVFRPQRELTQQQIRLGLEEFTRFDADESLDVDEELTANVISWLGT